MTAPALLTRILLVDDEPMLRRPIARHLRAAGCEVVEAGDGQDARELLEREKFDAVVSDITMPRLTGLELLDSVRRVDPDLPVVLMTANPQIETAAQAVELRALRYLLKPFKLNDLWELLSAGVQAHRKLRVLKQNSAANAAAEAAAHDDDAALDRAIATLRLAFQPIVSPRGAVYAYEALARPSEPTLPHPGALFAAAERRDRLADVGRKVRELAAQAAVATGHTLFVNLHPAELMDPALYDAEAPLSKVAAQVVLEITERAPLDEMKGLGERIGQLRKLGFRVAIDDLGAGYASLSSVPLLEPEVVKIDMSLVRGVHTEPTRRQIIRSVVSAFHELGRLVVAEGVETADEATALTDLGCDLLQGYRFGKPSFTFAAAAAA